MAQNGGKFDWRRADDCVPYWLPDALTHRRNIFVGVLRGDLPKAPKEGRDTWLNYMLAKLNDFDDPPPLPACAPSSKEPRGQRKNEPSRVEEFLGQVLIHDLASSDFFQEYTDVLSAQRAPADEETQAAHMQAALAHTSAWWQQSLWKTVLNFFDTAILEILLHDDLSGSVAETSFEKTLETVGKKNAGIWGKGDDAAAKVLEQEGDKGAVESDKGDVGPGRVAAPFQLTDQLAYLLTRFVRIYSTLGSKPRRVAIDGVLLEGEDGLPEYEVSLKLRQFVDDFAEISKVASDLWWEAGELFGWTLSLISALQGLLSDPDQFRKEFRSRLIRELRWAKRSHAEIIQELGFCRDGYQSISVKLQELLFPSSPDEKKKEWVLSPWRLYEVVTSARDLRGLGDDDELTSAVGEDWHRIDLGAAEFSAAVIARFNDLNVGRDKYTSETAQNIYLKMIGDFAVFNAVWLERRLKWLWWQAAFVRPEVPINAVIKRGLSYRGFVPGQINDIRSDDERIPASVLRRYVIPCESQARDAGQNDPSVVVFGAGIAGLTAAHELAARGFKVTLIERQPAVDASGQRENGLQVGGIARTQWNTAQPFSKCGEKPIEEVPGEHGYRFFPSFYRHLFDTMKRTPLRDPLGCPPAPPYPTAFDQLQPAFQQVFARRKAFVPMSRTRPRSFEAFRVEYMHLLEGLEFSKRDVARFFFKLVRYLMTCSERRAAEYEHVSLLEYLGGPEFYSGTFLEAVRAAPRALVAMDAEHGDVRTQLNVYLQLLMDQVLGSEYTDSTLRGPTSSAWLEHWREYLEEIGVCFAYGELASIRSDDRGYRKLEIICAQPRGPWLCASTDKQECSAGAHAAKVPAPSHSVPLCADYYVLALDPIEAERVTTRWHSNGVPRDLRRFASYVHQHIPAKLYHYEIVAQSVVPKVDLKEADDLLLSLLMRLQSVVWGDELEDLEPRRMRSALAPLSTVTGCVRTVGYYAEDLRVSLWLKQNIRPALLRQIEKVFKKWLDGTKFQDPKFMSDVADWNDIPQTVLTPRVPEGLYGETARDRFQTFTGVQFYFDHDFRLVRGHVFFPDTEWGLSAISQEQFWAAPEIVDEDGNKLRGILSVDVGDCRRASSYTGRSVQETLSGQEFATEVWRQIEQALGTVRGESARIVNLPAPQPRFYHVDANLEFDGFRLSNNLSPFLVNNVGDWQHRPRCTPWVPGSSKFEAIESTAVTDTWQAPHGGYRVHNDRVVFCGHYMRTFTRMNTMEAANESARHAVNAILDHYARRSFGRAGRCRSIAGDYCEIWDLERYELEDLNYFKRIDKMLFDRGKPHLADILRFDELADVLHPDSNNLQALMTALLATAARDLGVAPDEIAAAANSLVHTAQTVMKTLKEGAGMADIKLPEPLASALRAFRPSSS